MRRERAEDRPTGAAGMKAEAEARTANVMEVRSIVDGLLFLVFCIRIKEIVFGLK